MGITMKEEILQKILGAPLSDWSSSHTLMLEGVKTSLFRGGSGSFWLQIDGIKIYDARLRGLYYDLYERKDKNPTEEQELTLIYNKLCKIHKR